MIPWNPSLIRGSRDARRKASSGGVQPFTRPNTPGSRTCCISKNNQQMTVTIQKHHISLIRPLPWLVPYVISCTQILQLLFEGVEWLRCGLIKEMWRVLVNNDAKENNDVADVYTHNTARNFCCHVQQISYEIFAPAFLKILVSPSGIVLHLWSSLAELAGLSVIWLC